MSDNRQLLSPQVYSKELSLLVDRIVNGPRAGQKQNTRNFLTFVKTTGST